MPIVASSYKAPILFRNAHLNTIYKTLFLKNTVNYKRERILTPDDDFIDLDFSIVGSETLVVAMHGLEGSSQSKYIISVVNFLNTSEIDCIALNFRGCSGEDNYQLHAYNSGNTDDLNLVLDHLLVHYTYKNIILLGYSMGGNITLKYLGETPHISNKIKGAIAVSVPCDLEGSSKALSKWENSIYMKNFLKTLKEKALLKINKFPQCNINKKAVLSSKSFEDFDNVVTAPLFGFKTAEEYWRKSSCKQFVPAINRPTLLINALDDTFLSESCYPINESKNNKFLSLELPKHGGHVGFNSAYLGKDLLWSEKRILDFIKYIIS